ncbi:toxin [Streptomyces nojiriensis]|uniref:Toxin n=1 Tax=Streptomyces nojiriensis TaxID=66374 RepID=A0ABQ3SVE2_9ACTN|nr:DUF397 domain-containing protein [Streptomyces nojiriensis]QTI45647.1 hypothetical protein JYK04_03444 [Streptomyces nojiriensis]GGR97452.1 toxin [Streptomyces nojiriensis]GHI72115.1 toxin [Streptomyces nojiriensis]
MGSSQNLTGMLWRKSSYSGNTGGDCVECAPLGTAAWRKASYSGSSGGDCVEVAAQPCEVAVRDSKNPGGPVFTVTAAAFTTFVRSL